MRPLIGIELVLIPSVTLIDPNDPTNIVSNGTKSMQRVLMFWGSDLTALLLAGKSFSFSAQIGYRKLNTTITKREIDDSLGMSYLPVGLAFDFALHPFKTSAFLTYDHGLTSTFLLTSTTPYNSLDLKMSKLSRFRAGALTEFFISNPLSVFVFADYSSGSYTISEGPLTLNNTRTNKREELKVSGGKNKLSAISFGTGLAYYLPTSPAQAK